MIVCMGNDKDASLSLTDGPSPALDAAATPAVAIVMDLLLYDTFSLYRPVEDGACLSSLSLSLSHTHTHTHTHTSDLRKAECGRLAPQTGNTTKL
jgi:hypothetical protein